jgi:acyl-homoserine lactone synthase
MVEVVIAQNRHRYPALLAAMHRDRKRVFVDFLKWNVPVLDGCYEIDQFDTDTAIYLIVADPHSERHLGSVRLLPSLEPHILGDIFPQLCVRGVPRGAGIFEMTRLCVSPDVADRGEQRRIRSELGLAVVEFALLYGISRLTGTAHMAWLSQLLAVGWDVDMLGPTQTIAGEEIGAIAINITPATLQLMRDRTKRRLPVLHLNFDEVAEAA